MKISVVICTMAARGEDLARALASLAEARDIARHEVIVVAERGEAIEPLVAPFRDRLPLRTAFAPTRGLSDKRNVGVGEANGDVVAFLDDDAQATVDYLPVLAAAFEAGAEAVAGGLEPVFDVPLPDELRPVAFRIGGFNLFEGQRRPDGWIGANCAFRRDRLRASGPFDRRLGAGSGFLPWGDDAEMFRRFVPHGVAFVPDALVRHRIQAERLTREYVLTRAWQSGRTQAVIDRLHQPDFWQRAAWVPMNWLIANLARLRPGSGLEARLHARRLGGYGWQTVLLAVQGLPPVA